jgi:hypothetical protein
MYYAIQIISCQRPGRPTGDRGGLAGPGSLAVARGKPKLSRLLRLGCLPCESGCRQWKPKLLLPQAHGDAAGGTT